MDSSKDANRIDPTDTIAALGLTLLAIGLAFVYWPLALIVPGALLFLVSVIGAWRKGDS